MSNTPHHPCTKGFDTCPTCEPKDYNIDDQIEIMLLRSNSTIDRELRKNKTIGESVAIAVDEAKAQLFELITKEIIGDDQAGTGTTGRRRNALRATQRTKLAHLFNIKENK